MDNVNFTGKIVKKIFIEGKTIVESGLHIGGSDIGLAIGSTDNVIIRCALRENQPYIPGSSLKGKMRSLFEKTNDDKFTYQSKQIPNGPCQEPNSDTGILFGVAAEKGGTPSRVIVRDGYLLNPEKLEKAKTDMPYSEIKTETVIDRISSAANPRQIERVPADAEFGLKIILNVFEEDDEGKLLDNLFKSLTLVQDDYLGGYGSRGSGQVKFEIEKLQHKDKEVYENNVKAKEYEGYDIPDQLKTETKDE
jgi:CRISPR-associated protein Csm3